MISFKIEYYNRSADAYLIMHVVPVEWSLNMNWRRLCLSPRYWTEACLREPCQYRRPYVI